jgi:SAM-dependent methyltransferase
LDPVRLFPLLAERDGCPVCAAQGLEALHVYPIKQNKRRVTGQLYVALLGCERCGIVFSHPLPSDAELAAYYGGGDGWQTRIPDDPEVVATAVAGRKEVHAADLALLARHVGPQPPSGRRAKALDFGCGIGGWLEALAGAGWETYGIEPGPRAAAIAAQRHRMLDDIPVDAGFDLVVVHHTLEHLRDPAGTLGQLSRALRVGGAIWISVPNLETLGRHGDFNYVANDKHIFSFTAASLGSLLGQSSIELVSHSNLGDWSPGGAVRVDRLACVGRKVAQPVPFGADPLRPAIQALLSYGASRPEPVPARVPVRRWRRLARRALR